MFILVEATEYFDSSLAHHPRRLEDVNKIICAEYYQNQLFSAALSRSKIGVVQWMVAEWSEMCVITAIKMLSQWCCE